MTSSRSSSQAAVPANDFAGVLRGKAARGMALDAGRGSDDAAEAGRRAALRVAWRAVGCGALGARSGWRGAHLLLGACQRQARRRRPHLRPRQIRKSLRVLRSHPDGCLLRVDYLGSGRADLLSTPWSCATPFWPVLVLVTSIGVDFWRSRQLRAVAMRTGSPALATDAFHFATTSGPRLRCWPAWAPVGPARAMESAGCNTLTHSRRLLFRS